MTKFQGYLVFVPTGVGHWIDLKQELARFGFVIQPIPSVVGTQAPARILVWVYDP